MVSGVQAVKRQITRNRTSYSCVTCRRRKVKCDKVHPTCGGCKRANEHCMYGPDDLPSGGVPLSTSNHDNNSEAKKRRISPQSQTSSVSPSVSTNGDVNTPARLKAIEEQLHRLATMVDALRQSGDDHVQLQLQDLLIPSSSRPERGSYQRRGLSLDMFQQKAQGHSGDTSDLSRPLSRLKLSNGTREVDDPLWNHISAELDELNQWMRGRTGDYINPASIQDKQCPSAAAPTINGHPEAEMEDFWEPTSFHKEAGRDVHRCYDPDSSCPVCQMMPFSKETLLQGVPIRCSPARAQHHLLKNMPTRAQSNVLFRCWLSGVYPIMPLLNPAELAEKNEAFWDHLEDSRSFDLDYPDLEFLGLIHAIWYAASLSISSRGLQRWFPDTSRAKLASGFHDQVVFCLHLGSFTRNITLQKLAAVILLVSLPVAEEDPIQGSLYTQLVVRLATTMGLHREPTLFDVSAAEEGSRRRLWWQVVQMDVSLVVAAGFPSQISEAFCDTRIICEDPDSVLDVDGAQSAHSDQSRQAASTSVDNRLQSTLSSQRALKLVGRARSVMACALRSVVSIHLGTKVLTNADMQEMKRVMQESGEEVDEIIKSIPAKGLPELGFVPEAPKEGQRRAIDCDPIMSNPITPTETAYYKTYISDDELSSPLARYYLPKLAAYYKWARISLSMLKDKLYCVAYAPFLKNAKSKLWSLARQCALHNCHSFMRKFISLATDPDLEPFRWTWPAMHGPIHAVMIALVDLYERPHSTEAPRSRELIDAIFSLSAPESGIVGGPNGVTAQRPMREGGLEAWDMLRGLRSAAWQRAGLDPTVLWTEDDQLKIGAARPLTDAQKIVQSIREDALYEHDQSSKDAQPSRDTEIKVKATEDGVRYMVRLAQSEIVGAEEPDGFPCTRAIRNQFLKDIENDIHLTRNRGLARREGQQAMPFPLSGRLNQLSKKVADGDHQFCHAPLPEDDTGRRSDSSFIQGGTHQGETTPTSVVRGQYPMNGTTTLGQPGTAQSAQATETIVNRTAPTNGYASHLHQLQAGDKHGDHGGPQPGLLHDESSVTNGELGFDWERWDAVFGQYSGFTDLMEDVTWADHVGD